MKPPVLEPDGFDAFGQHVPNHRRSAGLRFLQGLGIDTGRASATIAKACAAIERDDPFRAMQIIENDGVDLTGSYRLLALLCTTETPNRKGTE